MVKKKIFSLAITILIIASGIPILSIAFPAANALNTNEADILSMNVIENVTILNTGEAQIIIIINIPSSPLADIYRHQFHVQNCSIGDEIDIPNNITELLYPIIGENFSAEDFSNLTNTYYLQKEFYEAISKEQQIYFGFSHLDITGSKMIPKGNNNDFTIIVNATSYIPLSKKSNDYVENGWLVTIGNNPYQSSQENSRISYMLGQIGYTKQLLNSISGEQLYRKNWTTEFCLPQNSQADMDSIMELNWVLDFGGGTFFNSSIDPKSQDIILINENIEITEDTQSTPLNAIYTLISDYQSLEIFCASESAFIIEDLDAYVNMLSYDPQGSEDDRFQWRKNITLASFKPHEFTFASNQGKFTTGGSLSFEIALESTSDQNGLKSFQIWAKPKFEATANLTFNGTIRIIEPLIDEEFLIVNAPFSFFIGPFPVFGSIRLTVTASLEISLCEDVNVNVCIKSEGNLTIGVKWDRTNEWSPLYDADLDFDHDFDLEQCNVEVTLRPSLTPRIAVIFYSAAGPYLDFVFYGLINMKNLDPDDPNILTISSVKAGINVNVGIATGWLLEWLGKTPYSMSIADVNCITWTYEGDNLVSNHTSKPPIVYIDDDFNDDGYNSGHTWHYDAFDNINEGISNVSEYGTVYIYPGIYYEHLFIDKSISLLGENTDNTILDGCGSGNVVTVTENGILLLSGLTIRNGTYGIYLDSSSYNNISECCICKNFKDGIYLYSGASLEDQVGFSQSFGTSEGDILYNPIFDFDNNGKINSIDYTAFSDIFDRPKSNNNVVYQCTIHNNSGYGINCFFTSFSNTFYHNKFIGNDRNAYDIGNNNWDKDHIIGGNYWDDYNGSDNNNDGLGDVAYDIDGLGNTDRFPLMSTSFIPNKLPIATFSFLPQSPFIFQEVTFNSSLSYDPDGTIVNWAWDLGDENISYEKNPIHRYNKPGRYIVTLMVTDDDCAKSYQRKVIEIRYSVLEYYNFSVSPLNIVQISDPHIKESNQNSWQNLINVITAINNMCPNLVLVTGDLVENIRAVNFMRFNSIMDSLNSEIDVEYIVGNHDIRHLLIWPHDYDWYHYYINTQSDRILLDNYYSSHGYIFLGLDSNDKNPIENDYSGEISNAQLSWLDDKLTVYESAKQIIIYMHHPVFSDKTYLGEDSVISDNMETRDLFIEFCESSDEYGNSKVSLVLTGHTHEDGVWEKDGKDRSGYYYKYYKNLYPWDNGYYHNLFNKKTKFIHTASVRDQKAYRLIQLHGENAVYRTFNNAWPGNPLPVINNIFINSSESGIEGEYSISTNINSETSPIKRVKCYWSTDEITWQKIDMDFVRSGLYQTSIYIDYTNHSDCINIHYKVAVENNHDYIAIKEGNLTDSITGYPSVSVYPAVQSVEQGNDFCIQINVNSNDQTINSAGFQLNYPTSFTMKSFNYEGLLGTSVIEMGTPSPGDNNGLINYGVSRLPVNTATAVNGNLATICFTAPSAGGTFPLDLHDSFLIDGFGNPLADVVEIDGTIIVNTSIVGQTTTVYVEPPSQVRPVESSFTVDINIDPAEAVSGAQFDLSFDSSLLTVDSITEGDLFSGYDTFFNSGAIDNTDGKITGVFNVIITQGGNVISEGTLACVHFTAKGDDGVSPLNLVNVVVGDSDANPVSVVIHNGSVIITPDDTEPPDSHVNPIVPYKFHLKQMPLDITVNAVDYDSGVQEVSLYYRYSEDNTTWTDWMMYGENQIASSYTWHFTVPNGAGYYEFYSQAVDNADNLEPMPLVADAICRIYPNWDVNMDKNVNVLDIITIGQHWDETGEPCWISEDINCDGIINILDIILVAQHWTG